MKKVISKILGILKIVLLVILVIFVIATIYQKVIPNNPSIFGFRTFSIITNSMSPTIKRGDVILVKEKSANEYKVGDIITFKGLNGDLKGKIVTHELVSITVESGVRTYYTKGLMNVSTDPAIHESQILGKYIYKFKIFSIVERLISTVWGFILVIVIPLIFIYFYEIKDIVKEVKKIKDK